MEDPWNAISKLEDLTVSGIELSIVSKKIAGKTQTQPKKQWIFINIAEFSKCLDVVYIIQFIIQQIVTLSKYGHDALDICHP